MSDDRNANKGTERGNGIVERSLQQYGAGRSILIDRDNRIIAGNKTFENAGQLGMDGVIVVESDGRHLVAVKRTDLSLDDPRGRELALADNRAAEVGLEWDPGVLKDMVGELDLSPFFTEKELAKLGVELASGPEVPEPKLDKAEELREKWQTARGQLWEIPSNTVAGKSHRLMCGDSGNAVDVDALLEGGRPDACVTDPPYGIGLDYGNFSDSQRNVQELAEKWLPIARSVSDVVVLTPGVTNQWLYPCPDWVMCWFYGGGQLRSPWGFNCWQPILAYGKEPNLHHGRGARPDAVDMNTPANSGDIDHPCPKPVPLWRWLIERVTVDCGAMVLDVFSGSGTTFCAAEESRRYCYGMEIEPKYVAVALERMADMGLEPRLAQVQ